MKEYELLDENTEGNAKGLVEMFAEYVEKIDRINHMFIYGRAMYSAWDIQELRYKWCGEVYRKLAKEPVRPTPDEMKKLEDRMDLEIARELGRHEAFQFIARHILDPSEEQMSEILFIYSDCVIQDFQGFVHEAFCQHDWFMKLMGAVDELKAVWEALFRTLSVNYDNIPELNRAKLAMCNLHDLYGMCLTGTANEEQVRMYHQRVRHSGTSWRSCRPICRRRSSSILIGLTMVRSAESRSGDTDSRMSARGSRMRISNSIAKNRAGSFTSTTQEEAKWKTSTFRTSTNDGSRRSRI